MSEQLLTIEQAAEELNMSRWTLRDRVTKGLVPHRRLHGPRCRPSANGCTCRGVRFAAEDIAAIKSDAFVPALGTPSRAAARIRAAAPRQRRKADAA